MSGEALDFSCRYEAGSHIFATASRASSTLHPCPSSSGKATREDVT